MQKNENLQKLCYEMDQMFVEQDFGNEDDVQELITDSEQDKKLIILVLICGNQKHKLPKTPQKQSSITTLIKR